MPYNNLNTVINSLSTYYKRFNRSFNKISNNNQIQLKKLINSLQTISNNDSDNITKDIYTAITIPNKELYAYYYEVMLLPKYKQIFESMVKDRILFKSGFVQFTPFPTHFYCNLYTLEALYINNRVLSTCSCDEVYIAFYLRADKLTTCISQTAIIEQILQHVTNYNHIINTDKIDNIIDLLTVVKDDITYINNTVIPTLYKEFREDCITFFDYNDDIVIKENKL